MRRVNQVSVIVARSLLYVDRLPRASVLPSSDTAPAFLSSPAGRGLSPACPAAARLPLPPSPGARMNRHPSSIDGRAGAGERRADVGV